MTDPPRHACQGRPMVCPGPCNPLKAHHHHHHHHHRHHQRQKPDMTRVAMPEKDIPLPDEFSQTTLLRSLRTDTVTSATSMDNISISRTSASSKIALIGWSRSSRQKETNVSAITQQILLPGKLEMLGEPSKPRTEETCEPAFFRKVQPPIPSIFYPKETAVRILGAYRAPRILNDTYAVMTRLEGLTNRPSTFFLCLTILLIYAGIHILLAVIARRTPAYQFFVSSQICGVFVFLMWRLTGMILIWVARIDNTPR